MSTVKATILAQLEAANVQTNRDLYARLLAGKKPTAPLNFIKKEVKQRAQDEDYATVLEMLADAQVAELPEAEAIEAEAAQVVEQPTAPEPADNDPRYLAAFLASQPTSMRNLKNELKANNVPTTSAQLVQSMEASEAAFTAQQSTITPSIGSSGLAALVVGERPALLVDSRPALVTSATSEELAAILGAPVPDKTRTYTPLAHQDMIELVMELLDKRGLKVKDQKYNHNRMGQQMFGHVTVEGWNVEQDMSLGFRNSYDKSMQAGVVAGGRVVVCSNLMFVGQFKATKMHYGSIANDLRDAVSLAIDNLETNYRQLQVDTEKLQSVKVDERLIHEILGELFFSEAIVTETQLKTIRTELKEQVRFGRETMWDIYNHTTEALKSTPAGQMVDRHVAAHEFYLAKA